MKWLALLLILVLAAPALATSVSITIYGTTASNAQTNITKYGANNTVIVNAWNTSYVKNITVNSTNVSGDTISFNISNVTANSIFELKVNNTAVNGYKAGANGMLNFTYTMTSNLNQTFVLSPAVRANGYNMSWIWLKNATIDSMDGNLTVGTTAPIARFQLGNTSYRDIDISTLAIISGDTSYPLSLINTNTRANGNLNRLSFIYGSTGWSATGFVGAEIENIATGATALTFGTHNGSSIDERGRITSGGSYRGNGSGLWGLNASNLTTTATAFTNSSNITSSGCSQDTVRQNTNTGQQFITISWLGNNAGNAYIIADKNNPPTAERAVSFSNTNAIGTMTVILQSLDYWKWTGGGGTQLAGCYEWH